VAAPAADATEVPAPSSDGNGPSSDGNGPPSADATPAAPNPPPARPRRLRALLVGCIIATALAVFLFVILLGSTPKPGARGPVVGVGSQAPNFSLPSLGGGAPVDLAAIGKSGHRPVVLNFFASWCVPCQTETPLLARTSAAQRAKGSPVRFVGVDVNDQPGDAVPFVQRSGITYPVGVDATFAVTSGKYGLFGLPQTFFINAGGTVVGHVQGAVTPAQLDRWLHRLAGSSA
jgi:cytochrome c biogenesis protein CcmG/thiol:disulfide interchange protein DsbE